MEREAFFENVKVAIEQLVGGQGQVCIQPIIKNNHTVLHGLSVFRAGYHISPTVYLEYYYELYQDGNAVDDLIQNIWDCFDEKNYLKDINMDFFHDFNQVKEKLVYKLVSLEQNRELLEQVPHIPFLDLAVCFQCIHFDKVIGDGSILIRNSHLDMWNIGIKELYQAASQNTPELLPATVCPVEEMLERIMEENSDMQECIGAPSFLYVMTNSKRLLGAACMLYPGLLKSISEELKDDLYIIPSSIHEVLICPKSYALEPKIITELIKEINDTQMIAQDILSYHLYFYDGNEGSIHIWEESHM